MRVTARDWADYHHNEAHQVLEAIYSEKGESDKDKVISVLYALTHAIMGVQSEINELGNTIAAKGWK